LELVGLDFKGQGMAQAFTVCRVMRCPPLRSCSTGTGLGFGVGGTCCCNAPALSWHWSQHPHNTTTVKAFIAAPVKEIWRGWQKQGIFRLERKEGDREFVLFQSR